VRDLFQGLVLAAATVGILPGLSPRAVQSAPAPPQLYSNPWAKAGPVVLDNVRLIDGTGAAPIEHCRIVVEGDRLAQVGPRETVPAPPDAEIVDLSGHTVIPGLIDLHFHIENDPRLALRQLSHGVTSFRDPGQWEEKFIELRRMIAADHLAAPRIFTAGPHIDGERPAYPADAVVARDPDEARRLAERNVEGGASSLKIYFRLPLASARAVIDVCVARQIPCTAHLEIVDARDLLMAGLHGIEHITSIGPSLLPRVEREAYRQAVLANNDARNDGRYQMFSHIQVDGPEAQALYDVLRVRHPWIDPTLAVFERRAAPPTAQTPAAKVAMYVSGFENMKRLTRRVSLEGARIVVGGHSTVPFAKRGEAPWREMELLVQSGFTPLEVIHAATGTAAGFLYREHDMGTVQTGRLADLVVLSGDPLRNIAEIRTVERVMAGGAWIDLARYREY
jgi:imidazolonepropionase-like amidohydrolase